MVRINRAGRNQVGIDESSRSSSSSFWSDARIQLPSVALLRWRLFANSLRTTRGQMELVSRIVVGLVFALGALGGAFGFAGAAWWFVSHGTPERLALVLWPVFLFWQLFPILATAFTENLDSSNLLRFPLSYPSYLVVRLAYGAFDPAAMLGNFWLLGIWIGVGIAAPRLLPVAAVALFVLAVVNILLSRMIFAWLERWLAQRRTREILGFVFILLILSIQLIGPMGNRYGAASKPRVLQVAQQISPVQRALPPGLAAEMIARAFRGQTAACAGFFLLLCGYGAAVLALLNIRLREEYRGENLSETEARAKSASNQPARAAARNFGGFSGTVATVLEKELRYLSRSGPMLLTLIVPIFMVLVFRNGGSGGFLERRPELAFPIVSAYTLLLLTNLVYNNFGADAAGIQFFFASPATFRQIVLGKNCAHMMVFALEIAIAFVTVSLAYRPPSLDVLVASLAGLLFAAPANLAVGNLLSIYFPKKVDFSTFGRQRASPTTVLASFGVQLVVLGIGSLTILFSLRHGSFWPAAAIFLGLAVISLLGYTFVLRRIDGVAFNHREVLIGELSRA